MSDCRCNSKWKQPQAGSLSRLFSLQTAAEQFNGREGETATLLSRRPLPLTLRGGGLRLRQFHREAPPSRADVIDECLKSALSVDVHLLTKRRCR